jgi:sugar O-acyltransferase (sialic acid O-acetyltransferase NeuD family)
MSRHPAVQPLVFLSAGGTAADVLGFIEDINHLELRFDPIGFLDDAPAKQGTSLCGLPVLGTLPDFTRFADALFVNCLGSASNYWRRGRVVESLGIAPERFATLVHPSAVISRHASLGAGTIVYPYAFIGSGTQVGRQALVMSHASINHDVSIGEYAIVASGAVILGKVSLGVHSYVGAGAAIRQGLTVGEGSLVGMGSVVVGDVERHSIVVGVPARRTGVARSVDA